MFKVIGNVLDELESVKDVEQSHVPRHVHPGIARIEEILFERGSAALPDLGYTGPALYGLRSSYSRKYGKVSWHTDGCDDAGNMKFVLIATYPHPTQVWNGGDIFTPDPGDVLIMSADERHRSHPLSTRERTVIRVALVVAPVEYCQHIEPRSYAT